MYPFIHLANGLEIPTFFLVISLVVSLSLVWISRRADQAGLPVKQCLDISFLLMVSSMIGSRLFHVFYENPEYYLDDPKKIFYLWDGGFVFFGGAFFAFAMSLVYLKFFQKEKRGLYFDTFAPVLAFAYGLGRLGCFFAGCCYGAVCSVPWSVNGRHPTQLYALFWELGSLMILLGLEKIPFEKRPFFLRRSGDVFILWVGLHASGRLLMESFRDDFRGHTFFGLSISSFFSLVLLFIVILLFARKRQSHGTPSAT